MRESISRRCKNINVWRWSLRYGWPVPELPTTCVCGSPLEIEHALSCHFGGLPIRRHIEVRNLLASCTRKAGCETAVEPPLQQLSGEQFTPAQPRMTKLISTSRWPVSGGWVRGSIFRRQCVQPVRCLVLYPLSTGAVSVSVTHEREKGLAMKSACVKSREPPSLRLCSRRQEEPASSRPPSSSGWPHYLPSD